jgi:serine/threonine protein kinase/dipeptidyl aminopeptidase/acylaminoacyl peptidase
MTPDRWRQIEQLFEGARARPVAERGAYLAGACGVDTDLRGEVESLLTQADSRDSFLEVPAADFAGLSNEPPHGALIGRRIGPYEVAGLIGVGGMGEVYRARDRALGRDVAIKVLPPAVTADPARRARFEREARMLAAFTHPNIATIHGIETFDGHQALVMELVEGDTLDARIARGPLKLADVLAIAPQMARALDAAHEKGVIHRDLKPANVKVLSDGRVKVLDFGLARISTDEADGSSALPTVTAAATGPGQVLGTPAYMSPEQARGQAVDKRTDIWAFGCVLYEMLTGRRAFPGDTIVDTIAGVLDRTPDWNALPASTPAPVGRLVRRCLEKDPSRRLRDVGDALVELEGASVDTDSSVLRTAVAPRSKGTLVPWFISAALAVALALVFWGGRSLAPADTPGPPVITRTVRLTNSPAREFGPAISPDGEWVAYYSDARGPTDIWVKYLDNGATLNLTASQNVRLPVRSNLGGLAVSPDGRNLAFAGSLDASQPTFDTWVMPVPLGGPPRLLLQGMQGVQWSPDGTRLTAIVPGSFIGDALVVADSDGSNPRQIVRPEGGHHIHWPTWSPDGHSIFFIHTFQPGNTEQSEIYKVASTGGVPEPAAQSLRRAVYPTLLPGGDLVFSANPDSVDLGLWWQGARGGPARPLTTGLGEHAEARVSSDGKRLVAMVVEMRQSLASIAVSGTPVVRPLTDGYGGDLDPSSDPTSNRIVFSSTRSGYRNLWIANDDGSEARPLTSGRANDHHPAFSRDGRLVAFVSDRGGRWGIWLVSADGGAPRLLAPASVFDSLTWSRDGSQIVFATPGKGTSTALSVVSVADGLISTLPTPVAAVFPSWSPTADAVAYLGATLLDRTGPLGVPISRMELRFVDAQGRPLYPNLPEQPLQNGLVAWSPDGRRVAVVTVPANAPAAIWIVEPDSRTPFRRILELGPTAHPRGLTWTRDGSRLTIALQESLSDLVLHEIAGERAASE